MHRRRVLRYLSAGFATVAGCNGDAGGGAETATVTPVAVPTDSPTLTERPPLNAGASVVDLRTARRTYALAPTQYRTGDGATVRLRFTRTATADHPATVEAVLANETGVDDTFRLRWTPPFGSLRSAYPHPIGRRSDDEYTYRTSLVFAAARNNELVEEPAEVHRDEDGLWRLADDSISYVESVRLGADETVRGEYALVGRPRSNGRPTGVYEFSRADERAIRVTVWETGHPGPSESSEFVDTAVPNFPSDSVLWFHEADQSTPVFVRPSTERSRLPARIGIVAINRSRQPIACGRWGLYKLQDGSWFRIDPRPVGACNRLLPGGAESFALNVANGPAPTPERESFGHLGQGRYAVIVGHGRKRDARGALLQFDAPTVTVVPTDDVTSEQTGGVVTATTAGWRSAPDRDGGTRARLLLEQTTRAQRQIIAEQVMQPSRRGLRNTLAFAGPDIERVVLRTDAQIAAQTVDSGETVRFRYDGRAYAVSRIDD